MCIDKRVTGLETREVGALTIVNTESLWSLLQSTKALVYTLTVRAQCHVGDLVRNTKLRVLEREQT